MPRMSKSKKLEWSFFLNDRGRMAYNALCRRCVHNCKQSFRAIAMECPHYQSKRAKRVTHLRTSLADLTRRRHSSRITPDQRGCDEQSMPDFRSKAEKAFDRASVSLF